jgi:hypothetical protein
MGLIPLVIKDKAITLRSVGMRYGHEAGEVYSLISVGRGRVMERCIVESIETL